MQIGCPVVAQFAHIATKKGSGNKLGHRLRPQGFFQEGLPLTCVLILHLNRERLPCSNKDSKVGEKCKEVDFQRIVIGFDFGDGAHELAASGKTACDTVECIAHLSQVDVTPKQVLRNHEGQDASKSFRQQRAVFN